MYINTLENGIKLTSKFKKISENGITFMSSYVCNKFKTKALYFWKVGNSKTFHRLIETIYTGMNKANCITNLCNWYNPSVHVRHCCSKGASLINHNFYCVLLCRSEEIMAAVFILLLWILVILTQTPFLKKTISFQISPGLPTNAMSQWICLRGRWHNYKKLYEMVL